MTALTLRTRVLSTVSAVALAVGALSAPIQAVTFFVSKTADTNDGTCDSDCSLREAIVAANATGATDTISFSVAGTFAITGTALPTLTSTAIFNGTSAPGYITTPVVRLDGTGLPGTSSGLVFGSGAAASSVSALSITGFPGYGLEITSSTTAVTRSYIGVAPDGTTDAGNGLSGIRLAAANCVIGNTNVGNVLSGNGERGILVQPGANGSVIRANRIGTNAAGTAALANDGAGIYGTGGTTVTVGGVNAGQGNQISGNGGVGIDLDNGSDTWTIAGNTIGLNATGTAALGNLGGGFRTLTSNHVVGSTTASGRNVISANGFGGVILGSTSSGVSVLGNYIGTNAAGNAAIAGQPMGLRVLGTNGTIGGADATARNVISGNSSTGITFDSVSSGFVIAANFIGVAADGITAVANGGGVSLGGTGHLLGGNVAGARNVISGNTFSGVSVAGSGHQIRGNYIGTNVLGTAALGNAAEGIRLLVASNIAIGGSGSGEGNVISGNGTSGVAADATSSAVTILGNRIGTNAAGGAAIPNAGGISLNGTNHVVGSSAAGAANQISGNGFDGIAVLGSGHQIRGNRIGTSPSGAAALGNAGNGIRILDATNVVVGGGLAGEGNLISGNAAAGIATDAASSFAVIQGNSIGTNQAGNSALANQSGITLAGSNHLVGGSTFAEGNLLSGNTLNGVALSAIASTVKGNRIGTTGNGLAAVGNGGYGIRVYGAVDCVIGGPAPLDGNVISGNVRGVSFEQEATGNTMQNNIVGLDFTQATNLPDSGSGIEIFASGNTIGTPGAGNVIAGFVYQGIVLHGDEVTGNLIQGNWIGTNSSLAPGFGNTQIGIYITNAHGNKIGGLGLGEGNVIANNGFLGVWVEHGLGNEISGNSIFGNALLGIDIAEQGVFANDGGDGDGGGNRGLNYPLISAAVTNGGSTDVQGLLVNEPNTQYRVELFSSPTCSATGFGEGKALVGTTLVTTGASGTGTLQMSVSSGLIGAFVTATVTDASGNTSEFSPCAAVGGANPGQFQFYRNAVLSYEGVLPTGDAVVTRSHGLSGSASVTFTSSDDSAIAGQDYTDSDQVLTFAPWEVVKTVKIPILFDPAAETDPEFADLALSAPTGGATLGLAASDLYIFDNSAAFPGIRIDDAFVDEGDSGTTAMHFSVHLSPSDHPVTVSYATADSSATEIDDYLAATGTLAFPASALEQTLTLAVQIDGDVVVEGAEKLLVEISSVAGGGMWVAYDTVGEGEIRNDDFASPPPPSTIFTDGFELGSTVLWSHSVP